MNAKQQALAYAKNGLSVIPTCADKRPACAWKPFTERAMTCREIEEFFKNAAGIGIVCGKVSGNLELLDFDDHGSRFQPWFDSLPPFLRNRLVVESTPSGGRHVYYRVDGAESIPGNRKLAMKADGHVLIETRGSNGYVKCAPSEGYSLIMGDLQHISTISQYEQEILVETAKSLDESDRRFYAQESIQGGSSGGKRFYAQESTVDVPSILIRNGWKKVRENGRNEHWERPGKDDGKSTSATWNGDVFYVFSTNAVPFEPNRGYNAFQVYSLLEHGGNNRQAAFALKVGMEREHAPLASENATNSMPHTTEEEKKMGLMSIGEAITELVEGGKDPEIANLLKGQENSFSTPENAISTTTGDSEAVPEKVLHCPGFVDALVEHTLSTAPYPNRPLAFAGALAMLSHLSGRNFRDPRNLRTNIYLLALADSGVGKDYPRKVNMNLAAKVGIMSTMGDRFASAEGLEDSLLIQPSSFFQVDEVDTLFSSLQGKKDPTVEKIYGALLQFATSSDGMYAMRKKAIQTSGTRSVKFDKLRAKGIREPHLTMLGCAIPKYLYSALTERSMENGLISRCLVIEAGKRGKHGNPHFQEFSREILAMAGALVSRGGFAGVDLDSVDEEGTAAFRHEPFTVCETEEALERHNEMVCECEELYDQAQDNAARAIWSRGAEKAGKLALLYAISENVHEPLITPAAVEWGWKLVKHLTTRTLYQASVYVHDSEFDALRQKTIRYIRDYGGGKMNHGKLLRYLHVDADSMRRVMETLIDSEIVRVSPNSRGGFLYTLV